jgi:hypothetical protein
MVASFAALGGATAASAHGPYSPAHGYVSTISSVKPLVLGLHATIVGDRLLVRNWSGKTVVILDTNGRPFLRLDGRGVFRRDGSGWRRLSAGSGFGWHDPRVRWVEDAPPAAVRREPDAAHFLRAWRVPGRADGKPFAIEGFLGYAPPPVAEEDGGPSWLLPATGGLAALVLVAGLALVLGRRRASGAHRPARGRGGELAG